MMKEICCYTVHWRCAVRHRLTLLAVVAALGLLPGTASAEQPVVTSMLPANADAAGGNLIVISGTGFTSGATVRFGTALSPNVTIAGTTAIIATVPPGAAGTSVTVLVTNPDGSVVAVPTPFTYNAAPISALAVTAVSPSTGAAAGGTVVTISGTGFLPGATVYFGSTPGTNVSLTDSTLLTVTAPVGAVGWVVNVRVTNANGLTALAPVPYTFGSGAPTSVGGGAQPTISALSPNSGTAAGGTRVTLLGSGFVSGITVSFGGVPATSVNVVNSTQITLTTPSGAVGPVAVMVTSPGGSFGGVSNGFTYLVATPQLASVAPSEGLLVGGTPITLTGSGFVVGASVTIGGQPARNVIVTSPTTITAVTPPGVPGGAVVLVTNPGGIITGLATGFTYSATPAVATLAVTGVSPSSGPMAGGTLVTITGQGFAAGAIVTIGGVPATNVTVLGPTQILASTPASSVSGPATVVVTVNNFGNALNGAFTYTSSSTGGTATTPPTTQTSGLAPGSSGLFVFRGGSNADLAVATGCPAGRLVLWATDTKGQWVGYIPTAPAVINVSWEALFPSGIPAGTPIYVRCS
ncbi:MAG: cell surface receptor IPT/TIG domain-containing protein [Dehalococcoidia bacterium]|nr:MAG: cell surface receptor IPT/TIG domain-containing protein [Dehalococcoidia bacterium]